MQTARHETDRYAKRQAYRLADKKIADMKKADRQTGK
jgi:hypothetical protein